jgi:dTDP-4-dehydrorhamnose reductase
VGRSAAPGGNSYVDKVVRNLTQGNPILAPTFEFRNPIDTGTLGQFLLELTYRDDARGIFHVGASDKISRYELTRAIAEHLGYDRSLIVPQQEAVPGRAPRGRDDFLATRRLGEFCRTSVPTCRQVIERALDAIA